MRKANRRRLTGTWPKVAGFFVLMACSTAGSAQALPDLVSRALDSDPLLAEGVANLASAKANKKAALAEHYPRVGVDGSNRLSGDIPDVDPELVGRVNLWAGGGIQAGYRGAGSEVRYYEDKLLETRENLAYEVSRLYLEALRVEAQLIVGRRNRERHGRIVDNLATVARYDTGRQYDLLQAQSRKAQVETRLLTLESDLDAAQSRLARYTRLARTQLVPLTLNTMPADEVVLAQHPSYRAQVEQVERADAEMKVAKSQRWPRVNLESVFTEDAATRLAFNWDTLNFGTGDKISAARQRKEAAGSLLDAVELDLQVRRQTSLVNYQRSEDRLESAMNLIGSSHQVTQAFEKQFQIARRSMVDLLNAYAELSSVESAAAQAESDRQFFALEYLHASARTEDGVRASAASRSPLLDSLAQPEQRNAFPVPGNAAGAGAPAAGPLPASDAGRPMSRGTSGSPSRRLDSRSLRFDPTCCSGTNAPIPPSAPVVPGPAVPDPATSLDPASRPVPEPALPPAVDAAPPLDSSSSSPFPSSSTAPASSAPTASPAP